MKAEISWSTKCTVLLCFDAVVFDAVGIIFGALIGCYFCLDKQELAGREFVF